jgi:hypothetical protein
MTPPAVGTLAAWDGIEYSITDAHEAETLADGRRLIWWTIETPDGDALPVSAVVVAEYPDGPGPIFTPADWQSAVVADEADIPNHRWIDAETGARAVMLGGLPYLSPFTAGPDARPGSYGQ